MSSRSFDDLPEDLQLSILSLLSPSDLRLFAATCHRFHSLCSNPKLWLSLCLRFWSSQTLIPAWSPSSYSLLYRTLSTWHHLIGFWRLAGPSFSDHHPPLLLFEWGPSFIIGTRIDPSDGHDVIKIPFLWFGMDGNGSPVSFTHRDGRFRRRSLEEFSKLGSRPDLSDPELVLVEVNFVGDSHFVLEESGGGQDELMAFESPSSSPPDQIVSEMYRHFANRMSPGRDKLSRKHRRKERGRIGRRRWEPEHYLKITDCCPTPPRPLQGLWKGIGMDMRLGFYIVSYLSSSLISCQRVIDALAPHGSSNGPIFWSIDCESNEFPFLEEEVDVYDRCVHTQPATVGRVVARVLGISSVYDSVLPALSGSSSGFSNLEGRLWHYEDGAFGFGFVGDGYVVDLKLAALNGQLLDAVMLDSQDVSDS